LPFLLDLDLREDRNQIWRTAHRFEEWSSFSEMAVRLVTCGTSEADAERILSMQRNIAGLHGTRFGLSSMEARLREWASRPTEVHAIHAAMDEDDELDDSDAD
jgi:hypothetical protein